MVHEYLYEYHIFQYIFKRKTVYYKPFSGSTIVKCMKILEGKPTVNKILTYWNIPRNYKNDRFADLLLK